MKTEEEIKEKIGMLINEKKETLKKIKTCDGAALRVSRLYDFSIHQLKWVLEE